MQGAVLRFREFIAAPRFLIRRISLKTYCFKYSFEYSPAVHDFSLCYFVLLRTTNTRKVNATKKPIVNFCRNILAETCLSRGNSSSNVFFPANSAGGVLFWITLSVIVIIHLFSHLLHILFTQQGFSVIFSQHASNCFFYFWGFFFQNFSAIIFEASNKWTQSGLYYRHRDKKNLLTFSYLRNICFALFLTSWASDSKIYVRCCFFLFLSVLCNSLMEHWIRCRVAII